MVLWVLMAVVVDWGAGSRWVDLQVLKDVNGHGYANEDGKGNGCRLIGLVGVEAPFRRCC